MGMRLRLQYAGNPADTADMEAIEQRFFSSRGRMSEKNRFPMGIKM